MSLLWLTFCNIFIGIFIAFVLLGGPARRLGHRLDAHTFPELLGRRFDSKFIQILAGLIIFVFMPLYGAAVLIGGTEFVSTQLGLDYDVAMLIFQRYCGGVCVCRRPQRRDVHRRAARHNNVCRYGNAAHFCLC